MSSRSRAVGAEVFRALPPGTRFRVRVAGGSMEPVLCEGDDVEAERVDLPRDVRLGDLVVVDLPGTGLVVHRVLWRTPSRLRTWGDGSGRMDPPVPGCLLLGRVLGARRDGRDVTPSPLARPLQWGRQFSRAAFHRLHRRLTAPASR